MADSPGYLVVSDSAFGPITYRVQALRRGPKVADVKLVTKAKLPGRGRVARGTIVRIPSDVIHVKVTGGAWVYHYDGRAVMSVC